jgi:hypothetical protein
MMNNDSQAGNDQKTAIAAMLSVRNGKRAIEFYKAAFGAGELFRIVDPFGHHWEIGKPFVRSPLSAGGKVPLFHILLHAQSVPRADAWGYVALIRAVRCSEQPYSPKR